MMVELGISADRSIEMQSSPQCSEAQVSQEYFVSQNNNTVSSDAVVTVRSVILYCFLRLTFILSKVLLQSSLCCFQRSCYVTIAPVFSLVTVDQVYCVTIIITTAYHCNMTYDWLLHSCLFYMKSFFRRLALTSTEWQATVM